MMFFFVSYEGKPEINYCLKLNNDLQFEPWCNSKIQKSESDEEISSCSSLRSCKLLLKMLNYFKMNLIIVPLAFVQIRRK